MQADRHKLVKTACPLFGEGRMNTSPIRVLCVDDDALVREGITALINRQADMQVVVEASSGHDGVEQFPVHQPDVSLVDLRLPDIGGIAQARRPVHRRAGWVNARPGRGGRTIGNIRAVSRLAQGPFVAPPSRRSPPRCYATTRRAVRSDRAAAAVLVSIAGIKDSSYGYEGGHRGIVAFASFKVVRRA